MGRSNIQGSGNAVRIKTADDSVDLLTNVIELENIEMETQDGKAILSIGNVLPEMSSSTNGKFLTNNGVDASWGEVQLGGATRNIGEIVQSTIPLTDAGLHLLDGSLIQGDGIYGEFVDYIAGLDLTASYFCTEQEWQASVTQYGVCGKFVYDSTNNTVRLPKITGIIEGTTDLTALGDLVEAGLPNMSLYSPASKNKYGSQPNVIYNTNAVSGDSNNIISTQAVASKKLYIKDDNNIVGNSSTVQPQTIKAFYYIVIATSTKTDIQVDIDEIATDLNGKADTDLTNTTNQAKILMSGMGMPSSRYIDLTLGASGTTYTAPANGWYVVDKLTTSAQYLYCINNSKGYIIEHQSPYSTAPIVLLMPVLKGDVIQIGYNAGGNTRLFKFYYAQGEV